MNEQSILEELLDLAAQAGIEVRRASLDGQGGGLCRVREKRVLFVDTSACLADQVAQSANALVNVQELEDIYVLPQIRQIIEQYREKTDSN